MFSSILCKVYNKTRDIITPYFSRTSKNFKQDCCSDLLCMCPKRRNLTDDEEIIDFSLNGWTTVRKKGSTKTYSVLRL